MASVRTVLESVAATLLVAALGVSYKAYADIEVLKKANETSITLLANISKFVDEEREVRGRVEATLEAVNSRLDRLER